MGAAKLRVDEIALEDVINAFQQMLKADPSESRWSEFLSKNLFLIESKYIKIIQQLNVVLASARKVDFGLVDSQGFLDLFEIKKPSTKLLAAQQDRGNYYWSTDAVRALVQAEKYLFNAERKAANLAEDINREKGVAVSIVRPRAVVLMGCSTQLEDDRQREDFRILRMAIKNVEVLLFDELLDRLRNQRNKLYVD